MDDQIFVILLILLCSATLHLLSLFLFVGLVRQVAALEAQVAPKPRGGTGTEKIAP